MKKLIVAQAERVINHTQLHAYHSQPLPRSYSRRFDSVKATPAPTQMQNAFVEAVVKSQH